MPPETPLENGIALAGESPAFPAKSHLPVRIAERPEPLYPVCRSTTKLFHRFLIAWPDRSRAADHCLRSGRRAIPENTAGKYSAVPYKNSLLSSGTVPSHGLEESAGLPAEYAGRHPQIRSRQRKGQSDPYPPAEAAYQSDKRKTAPVLPRILVFPPVHREQT